MLRIPAFHIRSPSRIDLAGIAAGVVAVSLVTGAVFALRPLAPVLSLGVLYVFAVLPAAVGWGLAYALVVSVLSLLIFNFFFLPPLHTLALRDPENWVALTVYLVTAHSFDLVMEIPPQPAQINSAVFSPDGKTLALICDDRVVRLLSTASGEELIGIEGLGQTIYFVQFAPDGKTFLTVSTQRRDQGGEYRLWRAAAHAR